MIGESMYSMVHLLVHEKLIVIATEQAFPSLSLEDPPEAASEQLSDKRCTIQGDNDSCEPDNSPASLVPHVQLARMPCKSGLLFK